MHAAQSPDKTAVVFEGRQITYGQLMERVQVAAAVFAERLGNKEQRVVALLMTNSIDFVTTHLAILHAGHITMPLDPAFKKLEIDAVIRRLQPAMLVFEARYDDKFSRHADVGIMRTEEVLKAEIAEINEMEGGWLRLDPAEQVATITFTSGTSGQPKGVPNTHSNHAWNIYTCSEVWEWGGRDSLLITLPLSHWYGLVMGLSGIVYHGNTLYLHQQSFDASAVLADLASGKISFFTHAPVAYMKILEHQGDYDLSRVRLFVSGSAPLPPATWRQFKDRFGAEILETYGSSETGRIAGNLAGEVRLGSPGKIMPGVEVKIAQNDEVLIRSGGLFPGYWKNEQATAAARSADGFWRTGDIGEVKDNYIFLKGRMQERIRKFGYTISPRDVEWALLENPNIREAFVVGRQRMDNPDDELIYFISGDISKTEVIDYGKDNLPFSWRADKIVILDKLPRTKNGKPHLRRLKEMAGA